MIAGSLVRKNKIEYIDIDKIVTGKFNVRHHFDCEKMRLLVESIRSFGVLQPVTLRKFGKSYELISGERRLIAAKRAGLIKIPAMILDVRFDVAVAISIAENQQREELYLLEAAESYMDFIRRRGVTYSEMAEWIGVSATEISEKLKVLQMPKRIRDILAQFNLTKEHIDAALILEDEDKVTDLLVEAAENNYSPDKVSEMAKNILEEKRIKKQVVKDVKIFANTISQAVEMITKSGKYATLNKNENDQYIEYIIKIEK